MAVSNSTPSETIPDFTNYKVCLSIEGASEGHSVVEIMCTVRVLGQYLIIQRPALNVKMEFCEVEVYQGMSPLVHSFGY